jgi:5'-deoxynucleotidase YfbR-like HD superfamily hydrolase
VVEVLTRDVIKPLERWKEIISDMAKEASEVAIYARPGDMMTAFEEMENEPIVAALQPQR